MKNTKVEKIIIEIINELESNPNPDGSISPNIHHWIEQKQAQLKRKFLTSQLNPSKLNKYGEKWCILPTCENLAGHDGYYCEDHHTKYYFGKIC